MAVNVKAAIVPTANRRICHLLGVELSQALARGQNGLVTLRAYYAIGEARVPLRESIKAGREAAIRKPRNLVWRNQLWRALYPYRFELENVGLQGQKEQLVREAVLGINPLLVSRSRAGTLSAQP